MLKTLLRPHAYAYVLIAALVLPMAAFPRHAAAQPTLNETTQSAIFAMRQAVVVRRDARHNRLLRALRQLKDPELAPLFAELARSEQPSLRIHGHLGLAEVSEDKKLPLQALAEITHNAEQGNVVSAAIDSDLLALDDAEKMLDWPGVTNAVKLLIATRLVAADQFPKRHRAILTASLKSDGIGRQALAGLLLHQIGDKQGTAALVALNDSADPSRDAVRAMLLQTAVQHELKKAAAWAYGVSIEADIDTRLQLLSMRSAIRLGEPRAAAAWQKAFVASDDLANQTRLAIMALQLAPWAEANLFAPLLKSSTPLIAQIGRTGQAIAGGRNDAADQIIALIDLQHPMTNSWALRYAQNTAKPADAQLVMLALITAYERGPERGWAKRLDDAVEATTWLFDSEPAAATALLNPILVRSDRNVKLSQGILLGLIRAEKEGAEHVLANVPAFSDPTATNLSALLLAKRGMPLNERQTKDFELLVRGGGGLQDALRIQAAWVYLKRTGQTHIALAQILSNG